MMKPIFRMDRACLGALSGRIVFGDGFPMALPWAGREVPLAGRQIGRKFAPLFWTSQIELLTGVRSLINQKTHISGITDSGR